MDRKVQLCKRRFDRELRHLKVILVNSRKTLTLKDWLTLVDNTKKIMLREPNEFFCHNLPPAKIVRSAIEHVFQGFLIDQRLRMQQKNIYFKIPSRQKPED